MATSIVSVKDVNFRYGINRVLDDVNFTVKKGKIFGLLGTNGAGKSTLIDILTGFRYPNSGQVKIFDHSQPDCEQVRSRSGIVLQNSGGFFGEVTVYRVMEFMSRVSSRQDSIDRVLDITGLSSHRTKKLAALSGGERRRVDIAMAIWGNPELLILDEPTTGLDFESRQDLWEIILQLRTLGCSVIIATHLLDEAELLADDLAILDCGKIILNDSKDNILRLLPARLMIKTNVIDDSALISDLPSGITYLGKTMKKDFTHAFTSYDQRLLLNWFQAVTTKENISYEKLYCNIATLDEIFNMVLSDRRR